MKRKQEPTFLKRLREKQEPKGNNVVKPEIKKSQLHQFADWLENWHTTRILQTLSSFLLIITLISFYLDYGNRQEEREARSHSRKISAWQTITSKVLGNSGKKEALEYLNSIKEPLDEIDLSSKKDTRGVYLKSIDLSGASLRKINLAWGYLPEANLAGADLLGAHLVWANMSKTNLAEADLRNANLFKTDLRKANLSKAKILWADLTKANLQYADLNKSNLNGARMFSINLRDANLSEANLGHTDLRKALLGRANLLNTDLRGANLLQAELLNTINLRCEQLKEAENWQFSFRDQKLACGASIPKTPQ